MWMKMGFKTCMVYIQMSTLLTEDKENRIFGYTADSKWIFNYTAYSNIAVSDNIYFHNKDSEINIDNSKEQYIQIIQYTGDSKWIFNYTAYSDSAYSDSAYSNSAYSLKVNIR